MSNMIFELFAELPAELKQNVGSFLWTSNEESRQIKESARNILALSQADKLTYFVMMTMRKRLKSMYDRELEFEALEKKYFAYNKFYEDPFIRYHTFLFPKTITFSKGTGPLLDALQTGSPYPILEASKNEFTEEVENDIKTLVMLAPQSVNGSVGQMRCIDGVGPLAAASFNSNIPTDIVAFLLEHGADPNKLFSVNGSYFASILHCIERNYIENNSDRIKKVVILLKKYGGEEIKIKATTHTDYKKLSGVVAHIEKMRMKNNLRTD